MSILGGMQRAGQYRSSTRTRVQILLSGTLLQCARETFGKQSGTGQLNAIGSGIFGDSGGHISSETASFYSMKRLTCILCLFIWDYDHVQIWGYLDWLMFWSMPCCLLLLQSHHPFTKTLIKLNLHANEEPFVTRHAQLHAISLANFPPKTEGGGLKWPWPMTMLTCRHLHGCSWYVYTNSGLLCFVFGPPYCTGVGILVILNDDCLVCSFSLSVVPQTRSWLTNSIELNLHKMTFSLYNRIIRCLILVSVCSSDPVWPCQKCSSRALAQTTSGR